MGMRVDATMPVLFLFYRRDWMRIAGYLIVALHFFFEVLSHTRMRISDLYKVFRCSSRKQASRIICWLAQDSSVSRQNVNENVMKL